MSIYKRLVRPLLFKLDAEQAHRLSMACGVAASRIPGLAALIGVLANYEDPCLQLKVANLTFSNPFGLAAGFDKSGTAVCALSNIGLGSIEIGSVSALPSAGNPRPRLARLVADRSIAVNYGLPNDGSERIALRLSRKTKRRAGDARLGINLVPTNTFGQCLTAKDAIDDLTTSCRRLHPYAEYININLSCPNAPQDEEGLGSISNIRQLLGELHAFSPLPPVFLKIEPTLNEEYLERLVNCTRDHSFIRGFQFNLAPGRPSHLNLSPSALSSTAKGAVSGHPTAAYNRRCIEVLYGITGDEYEIIASGGIFTAQDAYERIRLGASLLQIYTGLVYEGPSLIGSLKKGLVQRLKDDGFSSVREARGRGL